MSDSEHGAPGASDRTISDVSEWESEHGAPGASDHTISSESMCESECETEYESSYESIGGVVGCVGCGNCLAVSTPKLADIIFDIIFIGIGMTLQIPSIVFAWPYAFAAEVTPPPPPCTSHLFINRIPCMYNQTLYT